MSYTNGLDKPSDYFETTTYTGTGSSLSISSLDFSPDFCWFKGRNQAYHHYLFDSVRGANKAIYSALTNAETTQTDTLMSFDSNGFTLGTDTANGEMNSSGNSFVSWSWKAGGSASSNSDGSITSSVSANTTAGFSILTRTGTGSNGTVGHGLGVAPKVIINKDINSGSSWWGVFHESLGNTNAIYLNTTNATDSSSAYWNNTSPTSSVFSVGTNSISNASGGTYISYCFAEKKGYSKFGSYTGNGNADGTFVFLGFRPAWVMVKPTEAADNWVMFDNKRHNAINSSTAPYQFYANKNFAETTDTKQLDFLSNGFKIRNSGNTINRTSTFIYMAFAESPFVTSTGVPTTAR